MNEAATVLDRPRFVDARPMLIAGLAERHSGTNAGIPAQWRRVASYLGRIPGQVNAAAYGVIFDSLPDLRSFGYLAGVEVDDVSRLPGGFGHLELPAQRYAVFVHRGHVSHIAQTVDAAVHEWLPASGLAHAGDGADFFERYGEDFDPRAGTGDIEIWIPVRS